MLRGSGLGSWALGPGHDRDPFNLLAPQRPQKVRWCAQLHDVRAARGIVVVIVVVVVIFVHIVLARHSLGTTEVDPVERHTCVGLRLG